LGELAITHPPERAIVLVQLVGVQRSTIVIATIVIWFVTDALLADLGKGLPGRGEHRALPCQLLPTADCDIAIKRIEFDQAPLAPGALGRDQRRARAAERIEDNRAAL
jgi:hypothetical protein